MRFFLPYPISHTLKNLPSRFRGPHPTFEPFLSNFKMGGLEPPKSLLLRFVLPAIGEASSIVHGRA